MSSGIALAMPASWRSLDLDPTTRAENNRRVVEEAIPSGLGATEARKLMLGLLRDATDSAVTGRAAVAALYCSAADGIPLGASLVATVLEATTAPADQLPPDAQALADSLQTTIAAGTGERRDLPAGPGVRVQRQQTGTDVGSPVPVQTVQWYVLHPKGDRMAILSFSTPNVALAEPFGEVFDAIAWSLQWTS